MKNKLSADMTTTMMMMMKKMMTMMMTMMMIATAATTMMMMTEMSELQDAANQKYLRERLQELTHMTQLYQTTMRTT
jgi:hypothetical protein